MVDDACRRWPEEAQTIRAALTRLESLGLADMEEPGEPPLPERVGPFRILDRLGAGGMGVVYRARDPDMDRDVALKVVRWDAASDPAAQRRFDTEVSAAARLEHESIVPVHRVGREDGLAWFAMTLVEGTTLAQVLRELAGARPADLDGRALSGALGRSAEASATDAEPGSLFNGPWPQVCLRVVLRVVDALVHAHARGVLHRDVKPSNVMVTPSGRVLLLDFGLAQLEGDAGVTRTDYVVGSVPYMSPEQRAGEAVDVRTDVYAVGLLLWELLALRHPFPDRDGHRQWVSREAPPLRPLDPRISWETETVAAVALEPEPARRYQTARALGADLLCALDGAPVVARRPGVVLRSRRWVRRHPTLATATVLGVALVVVLAMALRVQRRDATQLRDALDAQRSLSTSLMGLIDTEFELLDPDRAGGPEVDLGRLYESRRAAAAQLELTQPEYARYLMGLGGVARALGRDKDAYEHRREALRIFRKELPGDHGQLAHCLDALADDALACQRLEEAGRLCVEGLSMRERIWGPRSVPVSKSLQTLALIRQAEGNLVAASSLHDRIIQILDVAADRDEPGIDQRLATALHNAAGVALHGSRPRDAVTLGRRAVALWEQQDGGGSRLAAALLTVGLGLTRSGAFDEAEEALARSRDLAVGLFGDLDRRVLSADLALGDLALRTSRLDEGLRRIEAAAAGFLAVHDDATHPDVVRANGRLGAALLEAGRPGEALALVRQVLSSDLSNPLVEAGLQDVVAKAAKALDRPSELLEARSRIVALYVRAYGEDHQTTWQMRAQHLTGMAEVGQVSAALAVARACLAQSLEVEGAQRGLILSRLLDVWPRVLRSLAGTEHLGDGMALHEALMAAALDHPDTNPARLERIVEALRAIGEGYPARELLKAMRSR